MSLLLLFGGAGTAPIFLPAPQICYPTSALATRGLVDRGSASAWIIRRLTSAEIGSAAATSTGLVATLGSGGMIQLGSGAQTAGASLETSASVQRVGTSATVTAPSSSATAVTFTTGAAATRPAKNASVTRRTTGSEAGPCFPGA